MDVIFVIPLFFSMYYVLKGRRDLAFLNVYLPCLILFSSDYGFKIPHFTFLSTAEWAIFPLGIALLLNPPSWGKLRRVDLWVVLYLLCFGASELRETVPKDGYVFYAGYVIRSLFPYIVGRRLIEPDLRLATSKRIVLLLLCLTPAMLYEYRFGLNPWLIFGPRFGIFSSSFVGIREGHARVMATFGHAIVAGMIFSIAFLLNCYLVETWKREKSRLGPLLSRLQSHHLPGAMLVLAVVSTRSRGPMITAVVGYSILQITRFRNLKAGAAVVLLFLAIGGAAIYTYFEKYTNVDDPTSMNEEQSSALYRVQMLENYKPIVEEGGWLGWGALSVPHVDGQFSIDNTYLLTRLWQGKLGLYLFLLIVLEVLISVARSAFTFASASDRYFAFVMLGALLGFFLCLYTVWLGQQSLSVCFLLLGWGASLQASSTGVPLASAPAQFQFKRVFS